MVGLNIVLLIYLINTNAIVDGVGKSSIVHTLCTGSEPLNKSSKVIKDLYRMFKYLLKLTCNEDS